MGIKWWKQIGGVVALWAVFLYPHAWAYTIIDDFTLPSPRKILDPSPSDSRVDSGLGINGTRTTTAEKIGGGFAGGQVSIGNFQNGNTIFNVAPGSGEAYIVTLEYAIPGSGGDSDDTRNLSAGGNFQVVMNFTFVESGLDFSKFEFTISDGTNTDKYEAKDDFTYTTGLFVVPYSEFPNVDFSGVQSITIILEHSTSSGALSKDYTLDFIAATPEPASVLLALLTAGGALAFRRRARRERGALNPKA